MNNYNLILDCIDDINDSVVTTESNVITSLMNSYYKQYELFTECEYLGKDPYKIYQEASIMDEVKEKSSKDKNKLISIVKLVPRLIIALINKIKNKLFKKGSNIANIDKQTVEETRKAVSKSKTGKIVLGGGVTVAALATGELLISKAINKKGKSSTKVEVEITNNNKVKCDFDIKAIKELVKALVGDMKKIMEQYKDDKVKKVSQSIVNNITKNIEKLNGELQKENKNGDKVEVKSEDFNIESIVADLQYVKDNMSLLKDWEDDDNALSEYMKHLPAAVNAVEKAINTFADLNSIVRSLNKQQSGGKTGNDNKTKVPTETKNKTSESSGGKTSPKQKSNTESSSTRNNINTLKKFIDKINSNIGSIKDILTSAQYDQVQEAVKDADEYVSRVGDSDSSLPNEVLSKIKKICNAIYANIYNTILQHEDFDSPDENQKPKYEKASKFLTDIGFKKINIKLGDAQPINFKDYFKNVLYELRSDNKYSPDTISGVEGHPYVINTGDIGGIVSDKNKSIDINYYLRGYKVKIAKVDENKNPTHRPVEYEFPEGVGEFINKVKQKLPEIKSVIKEQDYSSAITAINTVARVSSEKYLQIRRDGQDRIKKSSVVDEVFACINTLIDKFINEPTLYEDDTISSKIEKFFTDIGYEKVSVEVGDKFGDKISPGVFKEQKKIKIDSENNMYKHDGKTKGDIIVGFIGRLPFRLKMKSIKVNDFDDKPVTITKSFFLYGGRIHHCEY